MTSDLLSQAIGDKDNEILTAQSNLNVVQAEQFKLKKDLVEMTENVRKAKYNLARLRVERQIAERQFWASRGQ